MKKKEKYFILGAALLVVPLVLVPSLVACNGETKINDAVLNEDKEYSSIDELLEYNPNIFCGYKVDGNSVFSKSINTRDETVEKVIRLFDVNQYFDVNHDGHIDKYEISSYSNPNFYQQVGKIYVEGSIRVNKGNGCELDNLHSKCYFEINKDLFNLKTYASLLKSNDKFDLYEYTNIPNKINCKLWVANKYYGTWQDTYKWYTYNYQSTTHQLYQSHSKYLIVKGMNPNK